MVKNQQFVEFRKFLPREKGAVSIFSWKRFFFSKTSFRSRAQSQHSNVCPRRQNTKESLGASTYTGWLTVIMRKRDIFNVNNNHIFIYHMQWTFLWSV